MVLRDDACGQLSALTCAVQVVENLFSPPDVQWMGPDGSTVSQRGGSVALSDIQGSDTTVTRTLTFSQLTEANRGQYTCEACINIGLAEIEGYCNTMSTPVVPNGKFTLLRVEYTLRNVSIISAVEVGVRELSCERVSDSSLHLVWGEVAEGSDSVVGYRVEVQEIRHQPNSRELEAVPLAEEFDRVIEETSAVVTQGLGKIFSTQRTTVFITFFY